MMLQIHKYWICVESGRSSVDMVTKATTRRKCTKIVRYVLVVSREEPVPRMHKRRRVHSQRYPRLGTATSSDSEWYPYPSFFN